MDDGQMRFKSVRFRLSPLGCWSGLRSLWSPLAGNFRPIPSRFPGRLLAILLACGLLLPSHDAASGGIVINLPPEDPPPYDWLLQSGLFSLRSLETLRVLVTDTAMTPKGGEITILLSDGAGNEIGTSVHDVEPGTPAIVEFVNQESSNLIMTVAVRLTSAELDFAPVTTLEVDAGSLVAVDRRMCSGPLEREPIVLSKKCPSFVATSFNSNL